MTGSMDGGMDDAIQEALARDAEARARIGDDLDTTFLVEAAAGTGKTTALVARIVEAVRRGRSLARMVVVTYTDKASGELRLRLREELETARLDAPDPETRRRLLEGTRELEGAAIGTIHSFCADLLREWPVEAGIDPAFELMDQDEADALADRAFDEIFRDALADPPPGIRRVLCLRRWASYQVSPSELLRTAARELVAHRDFHAPWTRPGFERRARLDEVLEVAREVAAMADEVDDPEDYLRQAFDAIAEIVRVAEAREAARARRVARGEGDTREDDDDRLEAELRSFRKHKTRRYRGRGKRYGKWDRDEAKAVKDRFFEALDEFVREAEQDLAALLQAELRPVVFRYEQLCAQAGRLDFLDLLLRTRDLLRARPEVLEELRLRLDHVFVDEFQDTDPVQAEILVRLCSEARDEGEGDEAHEGGERLVPGKLFVVGDPKQAIYRFRRADVGVYEGVRQQVLAAGGEVLELSRSFRAVPSVQRFVNVAFAPLFGEGKPGIMPRYVPLAPHRDPTPNAASVVALPIPEFYGGWKKGNYGTIDGSCPEAVAAFVAWLMHRSGFTVEADTGGRRAVRPDDVCLLFTRMRSTWKDIALPYVRALEARNLPHVAHAGKALHDREEIHAIRRALTAIEWPDDTLEVHAVLKGPLFGFFDETLLRYVREVGELHPFAPELGAPELGAELEDEDLRAVAGALALLAELHAQRNRRPVADTLSALLTATRAHAGLAFRPGPGQALAGVAHVLDLARAFETRRATSFRAFALWLEAQGEEGRDQTAVNSGEGVRLMTVHSAKGLEWPVVVLCDPTATAEFDEPSRYVDAERALWATSLCHAAPQELETHREEVLEADRAEKHRVLYVAATRAREMLVLPIAGGRPDGKFGPDVHLPGKWLEPLWRAAYPPRAARPEPATGCFPRVGAPTVLDVPQGCYDTIFGAGAHTSEAGAPIVFWDPGALALAARPRKGMTREALLIAPAGGTDASEGPRAAMVSWRQRGERTRARAAAPSAPAMTVRARALELHEPGEVVVLQTGAWTEERPRGPRFGTLVHAVLAEIPWGATRPTIEALARTHARLLGALPEEIAAAITSVEIALKHPIFERAAAADECRREVATTAVTPDGVVIEGVVDLAFLEDDPFGESGWTVVDYKTDLHGGAPAEYIAQVRLYAEAITAATGQPAEAVLLAV